MMSKIKNFLAENKQARQERKNAPSWWKRKKNYDVHEMPLKSWGEPSEEEETPPDPDYKLDKGVRDKIEQDLNSRYDVVSGYEIPHLMIALKGAPTNNVGTYMKWKAENP